MKKICPQCNREFVSRSAVEGELCPQCGLGEFHRVGETVPLSEAMMHEQQKFIKRQHSRAHRLSRYDLEDRGMKSTQLVCAGLGVCVLGFGTFLFWLSAHSRDGMFSNMSSIGQTVFSVFIGVVAALLIGIGGKRHPFFFIPIAVVSFVWSFFVPDMWPSGIDGSKKRAENKEIISETVAEKKPFVAGRRLTDEDIVVLKETLSIHGGKDVWGVYIESLTNDVREQLRKFLLRRSGASKAVSYGRKGGVLFVLEGTELSVSEIEQVAAGMGEILSVSPDLRLIEVRFDAKTSRYESSYPNDVLVTESHPSYVPANIDELKCIDPSRVLSAAQKLGAVQSNVFREKMRSALGVAEKEPWDGYEHVYSAIVQALIANAQEDDPEAVAAAHKLFAVLSAKNMTIPSALVQFLADRDPEGVKAPLLKLWLTSPINWDVYINRLGTSVEPNLLELLQDAQSVQVINGVIDHLKNVGTVASIPHLQKFTDSSDDITSRAARSAIEEIRLRASQEPAQVRE